MSEEKEERIAKVIARAGICSRRKAEELISEHKVKYDGELVTTPAFKVSIPNLIEVDGKPLLEKQPTRLWLYYKKTGFITTDKDPENRPTVFAQLPPSMPRVISIGRLDINSEGLLLLTNDGEFARAMELPASKVPRTYKVRVYGKLHPKLLALDKSNKPSTITIEGVKYNLVDVTIDKTAMNNHWLILTLAEGKNREIRKILEHFGLKISRLIRISYGPFELGRLKPGELKEVQTKEINKVKGLF
jgi:23S rRNA pseudouridine2605 synthase